jgi:D-aspartate ligase
MSAPPAAARTGSIDTSTPVVIFGLSRGALHHGALGIARSAGRLGIDAHRVARERWAPASASRFGRRWITLGEGASDQQILETLHGLAGEVGRAILIPVDDAGSVFVDTHAAALQSEFLFPKQPPRLAQELSSKREMYDICVKHDVPTPRCQFPRSEAELLEMTRQAAFPTVVKCINAGDTPADSPRVVIAQGKDQLLEAYRAMESPRGSNVMLQEYIPGTPESVWMFNGYFDRASDCTFGITGKKIRQSPPYTGATTLGVCEANDAVHQTTTRLMKALGYQGILDIGYRFDERDGAYKLLDVNPRIGGSFRLFVAGDGSDVLRTMYLDLTGQRNTHGASHNGNAAEADAVEGRRWIVEPLDVSSSITYRRRGDITLPGWIRSLKGVREAAWWARDDPLPFLALLASMPLYLLSRLRERR